MSVGHPAQPYEFIWANVCPCLKNQGEKKSNYKKEGGLKEGKKDRKKEKEGKKEKKKKEMCLVLSS